MSETTKTTGEPKKTKKLTATYTEPPKYRDRGERMGLVRCLLVIDGPSGRFDFAYRMDEDLAHQVHVMNRWIMKGMTPKEAFKKAFPKCS